MSFWYLATPYSKYPGGLEAAFKAAAEQAALLVKAGVPVFSPIAHAHPIAVEGKIDPYDHDNDIWLLADHAFMSPACGLIVCCLTGWDTSFGISEELKEFRMAGKPIVFMVPGEVPDGLIP